jgi:hypothetical protein
MVDYSVFPPNPYWVGNLTGTTLTYNGGQPCPLSGSQMQFHINVFCDETVDFNYNPIADLTDPCQPVSELWGYLDAYSAYFGIFFVIFGGLMCFVGWKFIGVTVCLIGLITCVAISCLIFYAVYASATTDPTEFFYWLGGGVIAGIIVGVILCKYQKAGASMAAGWGGAILGIVLNTTVLYRFGIPIMFYVATIVCAAVCAFLVTRYYEKGVIGATAILGGYMLMRGIAFWFGGYVNEFVVAKMIKDGLASEINPIYWVYIGLFVLFSVVGAIVQWKFFKRD